MTLSEVVQSSGWKGFMAKLYGFGASVVIIGALFKIQHWPFASIFLTLGLLTEAVIFFFSAFEPLHEEVDWTLVYPELAGITDDDEMENYKESITSSRGSVVLEKFENLFDASALTPDKIEKLGEGFSKLTNTANKMTDITEATVATQSFVTNFKNAAQNLDHMTSSYSENNEILKSSINSLSSTYQKTAEIFEKSGQEISQQVSQSSNNLVGSYQKLTDSVTSYYSSISEGGKTYNGHLDKMNKNLGDLNTLYELQLKETNDYLKGNKQLYAGFDQMLKNLNDSVNETKRYREEINKLSENLASLNSIYGNMLSAMNYKK
jgi:gliding motility-associated protein GldL